MGEFVSAVEKIVATLIKIKVLPVANILRENEVVYKIEFRDRFYNRKLARNLLEFLRLLEVKKTFTVLTASLIVK